jgi:ferredoxin
MAIVINQELCNACGICGRVCPRYIPETIELDRKKVTQISPQRADLCMDCGHCAAVCPNEAIHIEGIPAEAYTPIEEMEIETGQFLTLLRQRRSIRRYKNKPVPREVIGKMVDAAHCAPTGSGQSTTGVIIIDQAETLQTFSELLYQLYESLGKALKNPIARQFVKRSAGKKKVHTLQDFVMPGMEWYIRWYEAGKAMKFCGTALP